MRLDQSTLANCTDENLWRLARSLWVRMPSPLLSDHVRRRELIRLIEARIRETAREAAATACVVAAAVALGVM
jgi:hypothetical protein